MTVAGNCILRKTNCVTLPHKDIGQFIDNWIICICVLSIYLFICILFIYLFVHYQGKCQSFGSHLLEINTESEQKWLYDKGSFLCFKQFYLSWPSDYVHDIIMLLNLRKLCQVLNFWTFLGFKSKLIFVNSYFAGTDHRLLSSW